MDNREFKRGTIRIMRDRIVPALIISDDESNKNSDQITYITLTRLRKYSEKKYNLTINIDNKDTYVKCWNIKTDFKSLFGDYVGTVSKEDMLLIDQQIVEYLGMSITELYEAELEQYDEIMKRIEIGKKYINKPHKEERLSLSHEAKMDIMENYTRETRDRLAEKYDIYPREKVSRIAYSLRSKFKRDGKI